jgi:hypothetical protein
MIVAWWLPSFEFARAAPESPIRVSFAPEFQPDPPPPSPPPANVPFTVPPQSAPPRADPVPMHEPDPRPPAQESPRPDASQRARPPNDPGDPSGSRGTSVVPPGNGREAPAPGEPGTGTDAGGGSFDLGKAMREFRDAAGRGRSAEPLDRGRGQGTYVPPDLSGLPTTGYGLGNFEYESKDYAWDDYHRQIYMAIWRAWHNRLLATVGDFELWKHRNGVWLLEHTSRVRFTIQRDGDLTGIAVEVPSGCPPLDVSAADALDEVVLPPLPSDFPRNQETVHVRFIAHGDISTMRRYLEQMKALHLF